MRILFLTNALGFGGLASYTFALMKTLNDLGHECASLSLRVLEGVRQQAEWAGLPAEAVIEQPGLTLEQARDRVRQMGIGLVVTSPPMPTLGDPNPYDLGCREVCLLHSLYSTVNWRPNGRTVLANDEVMAEYFRADAVLPVPVDLGRFGGRERVRWGVCSAGRISAETTGLALVAAVPVHFFGGPDDSPRIARDGLSYLHAQRLEEVLPHYRVCLGAGLVAVEAMASGCLTLVGQDTHVLGQGFRPTFEGLMTGETVRVAARYNYRGFQVRPYDRRPEEVRAEVERALTMPEEERREITRACRAWVEERHDARRVAQKLLEVAA